MGTDLTSFFLLAHPERVAAVIYLSGPFVDLPGSTPWRDTARSVEQSRRSEFQQARLEADKRVTPLEGRVEHLRVQLSPGSLLIGGEGDPRPAQSLRLLADRLGCDITIISQAGHHPWLEQPDQFRTALRAGLAAWPTAPPG